VSSQDQRWSVSERACDGTSRPEYRTERGKERKQGCKLDLLKPVDSMAGRDNQAIERVFPRFCWTGWIGCAGVRNSRTY
jgi:hypothetical protein